MKEKADLKRATHKQKNKKCIKFECYLCFAAQIRF